MSCDSFIHELSKLSTFLSWRWRRLITPYETKRCHSPERRQSQLRLEFTFEARSWHIRLLDASSNSGTAVLLLSNGSAKYTGIQSRGSMFCSFSIHWNILMLLSIDGTWPIVFPIEAVWFVPLNILNFLPSFLCVVSFISPVFCLSFLPAYAHWTLNCCIVISRQLLRRDRCRIF